MVHSQRITRQIDAHPRGPRDMPEVGHQAVGDVGHRPGAGLGGDPALSVGRFGHQMTTTQFVKSPNTVEQQRISRGRPSEIARHSNRVPGTRSVETYRCTTCQIAKGGH